MAALPNFPSDGQGERTDGLVRDDNSVGYKRGVGNITPTGGGQTTANAGVATHTANGTVKAGDPIVVVAGESGAGQAIPLAVDGSGGALPAAYVSAPISLSFATATGTLAIGTYYYRVSATTAAGETVPCAEQSFALTATGGITISWPQVAGATGYRVYGRTTGAELFIAAVAPGTATTYTDSGSITPSGAMPTVNTARTTFRTEGIAAAGSAVAGNPVLVAGTDGVNVHTLATDTAGGQLSGAYISAPISLSFTSTSGTLAAGTYYYRVTSTTAAGETTPCAEQSFVLAATGGVIISWPQVAGATGYNVYGRATGAEQLLATVTNGTTPTWTDNGSVTPSGSMPTTNTARLVVLEASSGTDLTASVTGAATALTATLPGIAGRTTFITGFEITGAGATAASNILVTVTGTISGTLNYYVTVPAGTTTSIAFPPVEFTRPIPASGTNTAIVVNVPSFGSGNTAAAVTAHGFTR
jgi:hypothetical protein